MPKHSLVPGAGKTSESPAFGTLSHLQAVSCLSVQLILPEALVCSMDAFSILRDQQLL